MGLKEQLMTDIKEAMRAKEADRLTALRFLQSALKNKEIDLRPNSPTEEDYLSVIRKLVKQRQDSIAQFQQADRSDLVAKEEFEMALLNQYLPQPLSDEELKKIVEAVVVELGAASVKDMGRVMKEVGARVQGRADNKTLSEMVKVRLGQN